MQFSKEQIEKAASAASAEELMAMAKADGIELTEEEAKNYYDVLHEEMPSEEQLRTLSEEELANVSGGSQCRYGKTYSSDYPYELIVTGGNCCAFYKQLGVRPHNCWGCEYCRTEGKVFTVSYCEKRTLFNDPINLPDE